ncbi:hypothetical protein NMYAN_40097 [Nitrosomonas nitrosa]|uniref:Uncharacterized protein n=1 Tax=Nitrosomonas nitrosa TaxID=52442 RepID=A0A8H8Z255_9PROT|nr:hypothetical protein NMYAN_40097 [Nitrosomonas nitrosa]
MVMRAEAKIFDFFSKKLTGRRVTVEIFSKELKLSVEGLKIVELNASPGGDVGIPVILLMILDINC